MKTLRVKQPADRLGKHSATIWRAIRCGAIDIDDENSIQQYLLGNKRRQNPNTIGQPNADVTETNISPPEPDRTGPVGRRGAAAALQRLEEIEERAHARLMRAIEIGNPFQVKAAQEFYLRASETLRRLDLAVETELGFRKPKQRAPVVGCPDADAMPLRKRAKRVILPEYVKLILRGP